jgi:DNA-binding CsgD family transcriptional regulator
MLAYKEKWKHIARLDDRRLSIVVFALFSSWLLAVPFEGRILFAILDYHQVPAQPFILGAMAAHCFGLILWGLFIKTMRAAKKLTLFAIIFCFIVSFAFFFPFKILWYIALFSSSFLVGGGVASWGYFLKSGTPKDERIKTIADGLIFTYVLVILLGKAATIISPQIGMALSMFLLSISFLFALKLPEKDTEQNLPQVSAQKKLVNMAKPLAFLCLFIVLIALNVGLMFHVQAPAFAHLEWLTGWYWVVPYIVAVLVMRNLPSKINRSYILYTGIAMIGFSYIAFILMDRSVISYLVVDTLMLGAFGIFNLFWWTMLGEMLSLHQNPARILSVGLSANVLGALIGALIGNMGVFGSGQGLLLLVLGLVCVSLVMLPPLYARLTDLLSDHTLMTVLATMPEEEKTQLIHKIATTSRLTKREAEIASLLITGMTYRMTAAELHMSENTVRTHVKRIYSKYDVRNRAELINTMIAEKDLSSTL